MLEVWTGLFFDGVVVRVAANLARTLVGVRSGAAASPVLGLVTVCNI